jgi:ribonucleoside-diphosphate reductase alpha chain
MQQVRKRDGRVVEFDARRITVAIGKAVAETHEFDEKETKRLAEIVVNIMIKAKNHHVPTVEEVQDVVEQVLMAGGHYETAKAFILYREARRKERAVKSVIGVEDDLGLSINQLKVIERRYLLHDEDGKVMETPRAWLTRVAKTLSKVEKKKAYWEKQFFTVMAAFEFLPAGRTLNNAGTAQNQLANCFVLPVEDSMEGIFDAVKWTALVHQTGGGTGFNFSNLRPGGDAVTRSAGGFATGPVSFMKVFDVATRQVMQGGKKRGANMGILNVDHPDIMEFITCKTEEGEIANFNISVGITDAFMKAVEKDGEFGLKNPRNGEVVQTIRARTLMDQIATLAWRTGDPGMIYLDAINRNNPLMQEYGRIEATNPCGEQPLHPFDACNLGSINLARFVKKDTRNQIPGTRIKKAGHLIDWERLREVTHIAVRMLDNVIDSGTYPLPQITETVKANRRIGLGSDGICAYVVCLGSAI